MDDARTPAPPTGTDEETRRHNNLRRDILSSLLEVDQSIKGLEHNLVGEIQKIRDAAAPAETVTGPTGEAIRRCEFNPAATTEWALKLLQDKLTPLSRSLATMQESLESLRGAGPGLDGLPDLRNDWNTFRDSLKILREDTERLLGAVFDLKEESPRQIERATAALEATEGIARTLGSFREGLDDIRRRLDGALSMPALQTKVEESREAIGLVIDALGGMERVAAEERQRFAALPDLLRQLQESQAAGLADLPDRLRNLEESIARIRETAAAGPETLPALREEIQAARAAAGESRDNAHQLREELRRLAEDMARVRNLVGSVPEVLPALREEVQEVRAISQVIREVSSSLPAEMSRAREAVTPVREDLGKIREGLAPLPERLKSLSDGLSELREAVTPMRGGIAALPDRLKTMSDGFAEVKAVVHPLREITATLPERLQSVEDGLSGVKEIVVPLREMTTGVQESIRAASGAVSSLREDSQALPGLIGALREKIERVLQERGESHSSLLREVGGKVLEEISLVTAELRRGGATLPDQLSGLTRQIDRLVALQQEGTNSLTAVRERLEQSSAGELTLEAVQEIQRRQESDAERLQRLEQAVQRGEVSLGRMQDASREVAQAFQQYHQAAREESERIRQRGAQEHNNRGVLLFYRGAVEAAEQSFLKAVEVEAGYAEAWNNLGLALSRQGKSEDAAAAFQKAIELDPKMGEVYNNLGFLYHTNLQYDRALEMFNQALSNHSDSAVAYVNLGNTYYKLERHEQAVKAWKRALELDPLNENARRYLRLYHQEGE